MGLEGKEKWLCAPCHLQSLLQSLLQSHLLLNHFFTFQVIAEKTEKKIDEARMGYKAVARHVSVLFFTISELASIEPMYQYSLTWFVNLFDDTIAKSEKSKDLAKRIDVSADLSQTSHIN